jgi:hypothetical protein
MSTKRIKAKNEVTPKTEAEVELMIRETVATQLDMEKKIAERDEAVMKASEPFDDGIELCSSTINANMAALQRWAGANRESFGERKSRVMAGQRIGFRLGSWKTVLKPKVKWDAVVAELQAIVKSGEREKASEKSIIRAMWAKMFLREAVEPAKDLMLGKRDDVEAAAVIADVGVLIERDESFFLDPEREGQADATLTTEGRAAA